jgi:hypothetical protein
MATQSSTLTHNTITNLIVGNKNNDDCVIIKYACTRKHIFNSGEIMILNDVVPPDPIHYFYVTDCGITFTADINGDNIRLICTVDNSLVHDVDFNYNLLTIKK